MELKDFISKTLSDISIGIRGGNKIMQLDNHSYVGDQDTTIDFDISVTYEDNLTTGAGAKITVASLFGANVSQESKAANSNLSRVKFKVLMKFNTQGAVYE
jgi:hypothetical protein